MSRRARAFPVWATLRAYGREGYRAIVERHLDLAQRMAARVDAAPDLERLAGVPLNIVCFRYRPEGVSEDRLDDLNRRLGAAVIEDGRVAFGTTTYGGLVGLRPAFTNWRIREQDVDLAVDVTRELGARLVRAEGDGSWRGDARVLDPGAMPGDGPAMLETWRRAFAEPSVSDDVGSIDRLMHTTLGPHSSPRPTDASWGPSSRPGTAGGVASGDWPWCRNGGGRGSALSSSRRLRNASKGLGAPKVAALVLREHDHTLAFWRASATNPTSASTAGCVRSGERASAWSGDRPYTRGDNCIWGCTGFDLGVHRSGEAGRDPGCHVKRRTTHKRQRRVRARCLSGSRPPRDVCDRGWAS